MPIDPNALPPLDLNAVDTELRAEEAYGDKPIEAFTGEALSTATFGLSDVAARAAGVPAERLREVRERSPTAAGFGTATGIVAPAVATLGTSTAAQGVGAGAKALSAAGAAAEAAAAKQLAKAGVTGAAATAGKLAARGAAEGAIVGAGEYVSDVALENKDLSAEVAASAVGHGALLGGGFGAALGTAQAMAPKVLSPFKTGVEQVKGIGKSAIDRIVDPEDAAISLITPNASRALRLEERLGAAKADLPAYFREELEAAKSILPSTAKDLAERNAAVISTTGKRINDSVTQIDDQITQFGTSIDRKNVYGNMIAKLDDVAEKLSLNKSANKEKLAIVDKFKADVLDAYASPSAFSFNELNARRMDWNKVKFPKIGTESDKFNARIAGLLGRESRAALDAAADATSPALANELKTLNKRYFIGTSIQQDLERVAAKSPDLLSPLSFTASIVGRAAKNAAIVTDIAKKTAEMQTQISKGIDNVFAKAADRSRLELPATQALVKTNFDLDQDDKKPKSTQQAFVNVSTNLRNLQEPELLADLLAKKTARVANASPATAQILQAKLVTGINFLNSKLPKNSNNPGLFQRPYQPSTLEMAKFARYVQTVESPLTMLRELQQGTLTREHVEALQVVYPEIYRQIQVKVMDKISQGTKLSYERRLQLGILLNIPTDSSMQPENLMNLQESISGANATTAGEASVSAASGPMQASGGPLRAKGVDQLNVAGREATGVQRVEADKP